MEDYQDTHNHQDKLYHGGVEYRSALSFPTNLSIKPYHFRDDAGRTSSPHTLFPPLLPVKPFSISGPRMSTSVRSSEEEEEDG